MAFCKFSTEYVNNNTTCIDNEFIKTFLPTAPEQTIRVYLYGLYLCQNNMDIDMKNFCVTLNLPESDVESAFVYWEELGLVQLLNTTPMEVRYLPTKNGSYSYKKYNKDKYTEFNTMVEEILCGRIITPTEFNEYYYTLDTLKFEKDALILIIKYCTTLKGNNVGYPYIITVARSFASDGLLTKDAVESRLLTQDRYQSDMTTLLKALHISRKPTADDYQLFIDWQNLGFNIECLLTLTKRAKTGGIQRLNALVTKCYENKIYSSKEVNDFFDNLDAYYSLAKLVTKNIGVRYDNLEIVVENYISNWVTLGFDKESLDMISGYCFEKSIRTLDGLKNIIDRFYTLGLIDIESIHKYITKLNEEDKVIKAYLDMLGLNRNVNELDRKYYNTWTIDWNISQALIEYGCSISSEKTQPMAYLNKILAIYHQKNIKSVDDAKKQSVNFVATTKSQKNKTMTSRKYENKDLNSLFANIKKVEL